MINADVSVAGGDGGVESRRDAPAPATARNHWQSLLEKAVFEIVIVAVGVLLALGVDDWRERVQQRQLANETRAALRAEILSNRQVVVERMRVTGALYLLTQKHPERVSEYVFERRNRPLLLTNVAWTMAIQTEALRLLSPIERDRIAGIFIEQQHVLELANYEMTKWTELASFSSAPNHIFDSADRDRAIRVWQAFAQRVQLAQCATLGATERALGADIADASYVESCARFSPDVDPARIYKDWNRLGWIANSSRP